MTPEQKAAAGLPAEVAELPTPALPAGVAEAGPESANAPIIGSLVCPTAGCSHRGSHIALHSDTVQPVHCGGCFGVLHCDHAEQATETTRRGTIGAPRQHTTTTCQACRTVLNEQVLDLPPIDLATLPIAVLDAPLPH